MKYKIFCTVNDGRENKEFSFEHESDKELTVKNFSVDSAVIEAAHRHCPVAPAPGTSSIMGIRFDRIRTFTTEPPDLKGM